MRAEFETPVNTLPFGAGAEEILVRDIWGAPENEGECLPPGTYLFQSKFAVAPTPAFASATEYSFQFELSLTDIS